MPKPSCRTGRIVVVVDPDPSVRDSLRSLLGTYGIEVATFDTAEAFLSHGDLARVMLLVIEQRLGGMTGVELLETLRDRHQRAPALLLASDADVPTTVRAVRSGAVDVIEKPFVNDAVVKRALDASKSAREGIETRR